MDCVKLEEELGDVCDALNIGAGGEISFINGMYVHVYEHTLACSELKLDCQERPTIQFKSGC